MIGESRIHVDGALVDTVKQSYPETKRMSKAGVIDWALRKMIELKQAA